MGNEQSFGYLADMKEKGLYDVSPKKYIKVLKMQLIQKVSSILRGEGN